MLCGDISQVPAEVNASVYAFQTLLAMPVMVWIGLQIRTLYRDIKGWMKKRAGIRETKNKDPLKE